MDVVYCINVFVFGDCWYFGCGLVVGMEKFGKY